MLLQIPVISLCSAPSVLHRMNQPIKSVTWVWMGGGGGGGGTARPSHTDCWLCIETGSRTGRSRWAGTQHTHTETFQWATTSFSIEDITGGVNEPSSLPTMDTSEKHFFWGWTENESPSDHTPAKPWKGAPRLYNVAVDRIVSSVCICYLGHMCASVGMYTLPFHTQWAANSLLRAVNWNFGHLALEQ